MELRTLHYFLTVAREQSISAAAESLHISQPALSTQLKGMEEELGKQLLIRGTKGSRKVVLTEEGMILRRRAEEILSLVQKAEEEITRSDDHRGRRGDRCWGDRQRPFAGPGCKRPAKAISRYSLSHLQRQRGVRVGISG